MPEVSGNEALILGAVVLLVLLVAWWVFRRRPERDRAETPDVLTPGAAPAERNTLLVDAPPAVTPVAAPSGAVVAKPDESFAAAAAAVILPPMGEMARTAWEDNQITRAEAAAASGAVDDLTRLKGVGPKLSAILQVLGVNRYDQIANWSDDDIARIDPQLGAFQGRIVRDDWVEQARLLAAGDVAGFEAKFGKV